MKKSIVYSLASRIFAVMLCASMMLAYMPAFAFADTYEDDHFTGEAIRGSIAVGGGRNS